MKQIKYLLAAIILVLLDSIYLNLIKKYFMNQIKIVQGTPIQINFLAVILCYIFLVFGLNYFIIRQNKSATDAFLLGLTIYAVYELTSMALLKNWSWLTVIMDTTWGATLFALTTFIIYLIYK
jgi:uncharacterized membrane protein